MQELSLNMSYSKLVLFSRYRLIIKFLEVDFNQNADLCICQCHG